MKRFALLTAAVLLAWQGLAFAEGSAASSDRAGPSAAQPFTFFMTHYVLLGDPNNPTGIRYESTGMPFAETPNGRGIALSGAGGWDPAADLATGGGAYVITDSSGAVTREGTWSVVKFISFLQLPGWWGIPGFIEEGWQGPSGSPSFSGFLKLRMRAHARPRGSPPARALKPGAPAAGEPRAGGISPQGEAPKLPHPPP